MINAEERRTLWIPVFYPLSSPLFSPCLILPSVAFIFLPGQKIRRVVETQAWLMGYLMKRRFDRE
jgi:hypothetical protein